MKRVFFFGDCVCFGHLVSVHKSCVGMVSKQFEIDGLKAIVNNSSVNGNTSRMALERLHHDVLAHRPDVLYIQFGLNDCNFWDTDKGEPRVSYDSFTANLKEMVNLSRACNSSMQILLGTNHPTLRDSLLPNGLPYHMNSRIYNGAIRDVVCGKNIVLVDNERAWDIQLGSGLVKHEDLLMPDHIHITELGHQWYFNTVYPIVKGVIV